jgi:2-polyprenyl-6-methoxyphenol hydroxylase-like FAD-dependent oxidoreductase
MSPFAGEGVNLAMIDAAELAFAITASNDLVEQIQNYEQKMFSRASKAAEESSSNLDLFVAPGNSAKVMGDFFKQMMENGPPDQQTHQ